MQTNPAEIREEVPAGYDRIINGLFLFLFFIVPLSRSGIYIIASFLLIAWLIKKIKSWNLPHEKTGDLEIVRWVGYMGLAVLLSLLNAQNIPAACAAWIPLVESSITIQFSRGSAASSAAFWKISGCGFEAFKSAPLIFAIKY